MARASITPKQNGHSFSPGFTRTPPMFASSTTRSSFPATQATLRTYETPLCHIGNLWLSGEQTGIQGVGSRQSGVGEMPAGLQTATGGVMSLESYRELKV